MFDPSPPDHQTRQSYARRRPYLLTYINGGCGFGAVAWRRPQIVRPRLSSPAFRLRPIRGTEPAERRCQPGSGRTNSSGLRHNYMRATPDYSDQPTGPSGRTRREAMKAMIMLRGRHHGAHPWHRPRPNAATVTASLRPLSSPHPGATQQQYVSVDALAEAAAAPIGRVEVRMWAPRTAVLITLGPMGITLAPWLSAASGIGSAG